MHLIWGPPVSAKQKKTQHHMHALVLVSKRVSDRHWSHCRGCLDLAAERQPQQRASERASNAKLVARWSSFLLLISLLSCKAATQLPRLNGDGQSHTEENEKLCSAEQVVDAQRGVSSGSVLLKVQFRIDRSIVT